MSFIVQELIIQPFFIMQHFLVGSCSIDDCLNDKEMEDDFTMSTSCKRNDQTANCPWNAESNDNKLEENGYTMSFNCPKNNGAGQKCNCLNDRFPDCFLIPKGGTLRTDIRCVIQRDIITNIQENPKGPTNFRRGRQNKYTDHGSFIQVSNTYKRNGLD